MVGTMGITRSLGMLGSLIGSVAIIFDVYFLGIGPQNWFPGDAPYNILLINAMLWILWFVFQGAGFLGIYGETDAAIAIVPFIFGLGAAFCQFIYHAILINALETTLSNDSRVAI